jgi:hypothetical protein
VDAFIRSPRARDSSGHGNHELEWVHVVIEVKACSRPRATKDLLKYIDQAFLGQPNRIFVHGMTVTGSNMTFYVLDRSAVYESTSYDCAKEPGPLIKALIGYQLMIPQGRKKTRIGLLKLRERGIYHLVTFGVCT